MEEVWMSVSGARMSTTSSGINSQDGGKGPIDHAVLPLTLTEIQVSHAFGEGGCVDLGTIRQDNHGETVIRKALDGSSESHRLAIVSVAAMSAVGIEKPSETIERREATV